MKLPSFFRRAPERRDSSYTDALVTQILAANSGSVAATETATAALEAAAGLVSRAFAGADVRGRDSIARALSPGILAMAGRALIRRGEAVFLIRADAAAGLTLLPASGWNVTGGADPDSWRYEVTLAGPSRTMTYKGLDPATVVHLRYAVDLARPWRGLGPLGVAALAGRLSAQTAAALADESGMSRGALLPVPGIEPNPDDESDGNAGGLLADLKGAKGSLLVVEADTGPADKIDPAQYQPRRFGADPPAALVQLLDTASREVYAACGINPVLFASGEASSIREAWRLLLFSLLQPVGRQVETELRAKLDDSIALDWTELRASDLQGRARAFQSLVGGGMALERAAALSGLLMADE